MPPPSRPAPRADIVVGIQWGDEGKGRVVDEFAKDYDLIARFGGGDNAGHSIVVGDRHLALHIVPSGVLVDGTSLFVGGGTVVSLAGLVRELEMLDAMGIDTHRVAVSDRAHIVFPYHAVLDRLSERARGDAAIGTTGRGIGPAYADRVARVGITFGDLRRRESLADKIRQNLLLRAPLLAQADEAPREEDLIAQTLELAERVKPHVVDGVAYLHDALERGRRILIEGAQGTMLDVYYGTYPYVTSSHTIAGGACTGLGIGPTAIGRVIGVVKAYCTRVGGGPFPSELDGELGAALRERGREFGVTTGRPRRCGWFDALAAGYAAKLNGLSGVVITKLDVLSGFERVGIVDGYRVGGAPAGVGQLGEAGLEPVVTWLDGWQEPIGEVRRIRDLPANARRYIEALRERLGVPIEYVSVGPERSALAR